MPFTVTMPKLSPTMDEGTIVRWHKQVGDYVEAGETLLEIATDKATVEHTALDEGFLRKILVEADSMAHVNEPICVFTETEEESIDSYVPEGEMPPKQEPAPEEEVATPTQEPKQAERVTGLAEPQVAPAPPLEGYAFPEPAEPSARVKASPLARKLARDLGLDLSTVQGTGPAGRIMERDLQSAQKASVVAFGRRVRPERQPGEYEEEPLTPMRKAIGRRLQESKSFIPHFYVTQEIDAAPLVATRAQLKEYGVKVTVNDFIMRAAALALREHPHVNSGFSTVSQSIVRFKTIDIAVAVSIDQGLVTPIVRHADYKSIGAISTEVRDLATRARAGKLQPEEYTGGSFTVSNLGMYAVSEFIAVINPPQAAILAVGGILDMPVIQGGEVTCGKRMKLTLSSDHRVIDGLDAAKFLAELKTFLENPAGLLL